MAFTKCIHRPKKTGDGHKLFKDEKGRISACDWSGNRPEATDDGPLVIEPNTIAEAHINWSREYGGVYYSLPVTCTRDGSIGRITISTETMRALSEAVSIRVEYDDTFKRLEDEMQYARLLPIAYC